MKSDSECVFTVDVLLKQSRKRLASLEFLAFDQNTRLCVVSVLQGYLCRKRDIHGNERMLLISYQNPYMRIGKDTGWPSSLPDTDLVHSMPGLLCGDSLSLFLLERELERERRERERERECGWQTALQQN